MWYYVINGLKQGPVEDAEISRLVKYGTLTGETLVWKEGMSDWQPARTCPFFSAATPGGPPPVPEKPTSPAFALDLDPSLDFLPHVLGLLTGFIGPLILMLCAQQPSAKQHAREALNWQISLMIYLMAGFVSTLFLIGFMLLFAVMILNWVFCVIAAIKASQGTFWPYPMTLRLIKE